jgi:hypothetical protein
MNLWITIYAVILPLPFLKFIEMQTDDSKSPEDQIKEPEEPEKKDVDDKE